MLTAGLAHTHYGNSVTNRENSGASSLKRKLIQELHNWFDAAGTKKNGIGKGECQDKHRDALLLPRRDFSIEEFTSRIHSDASAKGKPRGNIQQGSLTIEEALGLSHQSSGPPPIRDVVRVLQRYRKCKDIAYAKCVLSCITKFELDAHTIVGNYIMPMFVECGSLADAQQAFDRLIHPNIHSWTSIILGYIECGNLHHALSLHQNMQVSGIQPNSYTFVALLSACSALKDLKNGLLIHDDVRKFRFEKNPFVASALVNMYAKCGLLAEAQEVFDKLPFRNVVSWTTLISGYIEYGFGCEALKCFRQMQVEGISPNAATFVCCLKACAILKAIDKGCEIHIQIADKGLEKDHFICCSLIDMYSKCGAVEKAQDVFSQLSTQDVVSWNALIAGYIENGLNEEALKCFERMQHCVHPNDVTFVCLLKACGNLGAINKGWELHTLIASKGLLQILFVGTALVDMYIKCGSLVEAQRVFDKLPVRNVVTWTTLIMGYADHGPCEKALKCLEKMQEEGLCPNTVTFVCSLRACGSIGAINKGRKLHLQIIERGYERDAFVGSALVDMYGKCGFPREAREVFDKLPIPDLASWNAMVRGHGMNNEGNMAIQCFCKMQQAGVKPDAITFICLLAACSRANLVCKGQEYFETMTKEYGIHATSDHYTCMVDLLARSGCLYEAEKLLETAPHMSSEEAWIALLSACKGYGESEVGQRSFQKLMQINPRNAASYVLMAGVYASIGKLDSALRIEEMRRHAGAKKKPATSFIELNDEIYEFVVGHQNEAVSVILENLRLRLQGGGYVPSTEMILKPVSEMEKEAELCGHAEKIAIGFGLLHTPQGQSLHVSKNLRMCRDCHNATKIISRMERREIIVRESNWVHHFKAGLCCCGDMW